MAKLNLNTIGTGYASNTALNTNFDLIETALENTLSRDGTTPNTMSADLDMNGYGILNVTSLEVNGVDVSTLTSSATESAASAAAALVSENNAAASEVAAAASAAIVADWDYLGAWVTSTAYLVNNIVYVSSEGASYICLVAHTSGTFATDLGAGKWGLLATRGAAGAGTGDMLKSENLSGLANYTTARSNLGLSIGTNVQAYNATLAAISSGNVVCAWPIGSVFTSLVATNPATLLGGGTWVACGAGRVLVGIDATQTEFDTLRETGGAKTHTLTNSEMPIHNHQSVAAYDGLGGNFPAQGGAVMKNNSGNNPTIIMSSSEGGGAAHNNLQPYLVVYFWERTA